MYVCVFLNTLYCIVVLIFMQADMAILNNIDFIRCTLCMAAVIAENQRKTVIT